MTILKSMTTEDELYDYAKKHNIPLNLVCMKDELPDDPQDGGYIINMQSSSDGNGTHWVSLFLENGRAAYFDSFGIVPPVEVAKFIENYYEAFMSDKHIQNIAGGWCGAYCLYFIYCMSKGKGSMKHRYIKFLDQFKDLNI